MVYDIAAHRYDDGAVTGIQGAVPDDSQKRIQIARAE
jgi:hypothetical protein